MEEEKKLTEDVDYSAILLPKEDDGVLIPEWCILHDKDMWWNDIYDHNREWIPDYFANLFKK